MNGLRLVLDVDGVVIRGRPDDGLPWYQTLREDLGLDREVLTDRFFNAGFLDALRGRADIGELLEDLFSSLDAPTTVEAFIDYWFSHDARLNDDLIELTHELRLRSGLRCFLATNQERHRTMHIWETLGLNKLFDAMVSSSDLGVCKPEPEFFRRAQQRLELTTDDRVLFVDDREQFVQAAQRHGWEAVLFRDNNDLCSRLGSWVADHGDEA